METVRYFACVNANQSLGEQVWRDIAETLAGMQTVATGFSFPPLTEGYQWKLQQLAMADADCCIFAVGADYGPLSASGVGLLHQAFVHAQTMGKPLLVLDCAALGKKGDAVDQRRRQGMMADMAQQLKAESSVLARVTHASEVRDIVERFMDDLVSDNRLKGWRPLGSHRGDATIHQDLRRQVEQLQDRLEALRLKSGDVSHGHPAPTLTYRIKVFQDGNMTPQEYSLNLDWERLFQVVAPLVTEPQSETDFKSLLEDRLLQIATPSLKGRHPKAHGFIAFRLDGVVFDQVKKHYRRLGWLYLTQGIWQLSELGESHWLQGA